MTPSDKLREIAEKWGWFVKTISLDNHRFELNKNPEQLLFYIPFADEGM